MSTRAALSLLFPSLMLIGGCAGSATRDPSTAREVITPELMHQHLFALASDEMQGRNTPSRGLDSAAHYIAREFARVGLLPIRGSYLQPVPLHSVSLGDTNALSLIVEGKAEAYALKTDFTPFEMTADNEVEGDVVFTGYGITAPEYQYDDYASIDVKGKIVFVLRHEPGEEDSTALFMGKTATKYSQVSEKVKVAAAHGAVAVMVATDPLNHTLLTPRGYPWPSLSEFIPRDAVPLTLGVDESQKIPVIHVGPKVIARLVGSVDSLRRVQAELDWTMKPRSVLLKGVRARIRTSTQITQKLTNNVIGMIQGTDPALRGEFVILGAHYDHVGIARQHEPGADSIFNGADDNASGTAALLGVAAAFGADGEKPRRSVLLMAFAGEEKGLLGSEYYARNPFFPLDSTVAMLNIDMVGRNGEDTLYLVGSGPNSDLPPIAQAQNVLTGFVLLETELTAGGSDHATFQERKIPSVHFFTGLHPDFHKVSDNPGLINVRKVARVAQLVYLTAWEMANEQTWYRFTNPQLMSHTH